MDKVSYNELEEMQKLEITLTNLGAREFKSEDFERYTEAEVFQYIKKPIIYSVQLYGADVDVIGDSAGVNVILYTDKYIYRYTKKIENYNKVANTIITLIKKMKDFHYSFALEDYLKESDYARTEESRKEKYYNE